MKIQKSLDTKEIGMNVKKLRKARSMKQDELGEILGGLSRGQVSNLETGKRNFNIHQLKVLSDYFGVSLEALGVKVNEVDTLDLLQRARLIFENNDIPIEEKRNLYETIMKLYINANDQIKNI